MRLHGLGHSLSAVVDELCVPVPVLICF